MWVAPCEHNPNWAKEENEGMCEAVIDYKKLYEEERDKRENTEKYVEKLIERIDDLERRLEKYRLVVKCVEAFTGEKFDIG